MGNNQLYEHASQFNQAVSALIEMEAMKAQNQAMAQAGNPPMYLEADFLNLLELHDLGYNSCVEKKRRFF